MNSHIFLDESGDLGFNFDKKRTSRYFMISCLFVKQKGPVEKIVKKIFKSFPPNILKNHPGCLHAYKEKPKYKLKLLTLLNKQDISILNIYLNKKKVYTKLQDEKHILYNYVTNILLDRIYTKKLIPTNMPITLVASQRETNKFLNLNFKQYLENQTKSNHKLKIDIKIKPAKSEKCLQVVDFVSWALFRKREHGDESYSDLIKQRIVEENPLFP